MKTAVTEWVTWKYNNAFHDSEIVQITVTRTAGKADGEYASTCEANHKA